LLSKKDFITQCGVSKLGKRKLLILTVWNSEKRNTFKFCRFSLFGLKNPESINHIVNLTLYKNEGV
jgi:hypothetical protein